MKKPLPPPVPEDFCEDAKPVLRIVTSEDVLAAFHSAPRKRVSAVKKIWDLAVAIDEVRRLIEREAHGVPNVWMDASGPIIVGLHAYCYEQVYGVPMELTSQERERYGYRGNALIEALGGPNEAIEYVRWVWAREEQREAERRQGRAVYGSTLTIHSLLCSSFLLNDYRLARVRYREEQRSSVRLAR